MIIINEPIDGDILYKNLKNSERKYYEEMYENLKRGLYGDFTKYDDIIKVYTDHRLNEFEICKNQLIDIIETLPFRNLKNIEKYKNITDNNIPLKIPLD